MHECNPRGDRGLDFAKIAKKKQKHIFGQVPTAQKCCKKQYELKVSVFNDSKKHSCNECKPHADQDMKVAKKKMEKV